MAVEDSFIKKVNERVRLARIEQELAAEAILELRSSLEHLHRASNRPVELLDLYQDRIAPGIWK